MKAVFLIIDYVPHQENTIKKLVEKTNGEVLAFHAALFDKSIPEIKNFETHQYSQFTKQDILKKIKDFQPDFIVTAGWMIKEFIWICKQITKEGKIPVIAQSDTPWYGKITQKINSAISPFHLSKAFTHLWVAGYYQYEYARKLGFDNNKILLNSLSADVDLFNRVNIEEKKKSYPKNLLFIGRFSEEKGIKELLNAWKNIQDKKQWNLVLIGRGDLKDEISKNNDVIVKDYMSQENLLLEMQNSGAFILPSTFEPWALVLHEAASAGLPIICTDVCGASPHFVINNYNGYKVKPDTALLKNAIEKLISKTDDELLDFSYNSRTLGNSITQDTSIANLLQVIS
ncbi:glycosyltransferase [Chryseobacterium sp. HMWF035]|uniref:glycosyltransferase n=2 Tax=unclassified Chryseobacterium TaxID=2593645 RepID=UPI000D57CCA3|nr:glycosyltransferase [Chryseobacterium sp. HMWF035]PVV59726.1 glycoside hydrolase [Chryseobacterium sp. HMWF035]